MGEKKKNLKEYSSFFVLLDGKFMKLKNDLFSMVHGR